MKTLLISVLSLAVAFAGLSQASSAAAPVRKPIAGAVRVPDNEVEYTIRAKFARSKINVEHFTVSVKNGVATIDGKTNVIQHKGVATRLAKTGGAVAVQNRIQISAEARAKAAARLAQNRGQTPVARAAVIQPGR